MLLRGEGRYSDDLSLPGQAYAVIVRSRYAHGELNGVDVAEALAIPGVLAVITVADLEAAGIGPMQAAGGTHRDGSPMPKPYQMALAKNRVRYVGDPVAVVVGETRDAAKDGAEAVMLDITPLPAVTGGKGGGGSPARRNSTTMHPAIWCWITITAIPQRSTPPSRPLPTSPNSICAIAGSWWRRWSRARPWRRSRTGD